MNILLTKLRSISAPATRPTVRSSMDDRIATGDYCMMSSFAAVGAGIVTVAAATHGADMMIPTCLAGAATGLATASASFFNWKTESMTQGALPPSALAGLKGALVGGVTFGLVAAAGAISPAAGLAATAVGAVALGLHAGSDSATGDGEATVPAAIIGGLVLAAGAVVGSNLGPAGAILMAGVGAVCGGSMAAWFPRRP